jgi:hypothetical protein
MSKRPKKVTVKDKMQKGYQYLLTEQEERNFDVRFKPELSPKKMLELGVFGGKYMTDCQPEFPTDWFESAKLSKNQQNANMNYFGVLASQPLKVWQAKGWIYFEDPRGWFQWYCRYFMGRRIHFEDDRQIKRWLNMKRHVMQIIKNCQPGNLECRKKQRQALLQWAYDSRKI